MGCRLEGFTLANSQTRLLNDSELDEHSEANVDACSNDLSQSGSEELPFLKKIIHRD